MSKKILIVYVFSKFDPIERLTEFSKFYKKYDSGISHKLLICFKLLNNSKLYKCREILNDIKYIEYIDNSLVNDYEFKTMERAIKPYINHLVLFLISHCQPNKINWLKTIYNSYEEKSFIGISGSHESMFTSLKFKKFWKIFYNLNNFLFFKKNFKSFPNPHIRLPAFFLKQSDFLEFVKNKNYKNKKDAWITEAGKSGMTNYFKKNNFNIFVINSDGKKFKLNDMKYSETYCYKNQDKLLISDRHTRNFLKLNDLEKVKAETRNWG